VFTNNAIIAITVKLTIRQHINIIQQEKPKINLNFYKVIGGKKFDITKYYKRHYRLFFATIKYLAAPAAWSNFPICSSP